MSKAVQWASVGTAVAAVSAAAAAFYWWRKRTRRAAENHVTFAADDAPDCHVVESRLAAADPEQTAMMREQCIVVDENDCPVRPGSKKECHLMSNISRGLLHRAFSVFLFNTKGELMLQKRSGAKITFPSYWANTCCSHPLWRPEEMETEGHIGVKVAAQRKLSQELGIPPEDVPLDCFTFLSRVHYRAGCDDDLWGEHEIDHILVATPARDVRVEPNPNEVEETRYFSPQELHEWLAVADKTGEKVSPWFRIIAGTHLPRWWDAVQSLRQSQATRGSRDDRDGSASLAPFVEETAIHRAGDFDAREPALDAPNDTRADASGSRSRAVA